VASFTVKVKPEDLGKIAAEIVRPERLMKQLGAQVVSYSQKAFELQRLGDERWPARYPGQAPPKLNIAGALMDWKAGRAAPKPHRFQDRPANVDLGLRGGLWGSISARVTGPTSFEVGSTKPYAGLQQYGGQTSIRYGEDVKRRMREWLYDGKGKPRASRASAKVKTPRSEYERKIRPLLKRDVWEQSVIARPFIGMTRELEHDLQARTEEFFTGMVR